VLSKNQTTAEIAIAIVSPYIEDQVDAGTISLAVEDGEWKACGFEPR
jgi:hypothetical protein